MAPKLPVDEPFERYRQRLQWRMAVLLGLLFVPLLMAVAWANLQDDRLAATWVSAAAATVLAAASWISWRRGADSGGRLFFMSGAGVVAALPLLGWLSGTDMHFWFYVLPPLLAFLGIGRWFLPLVLAYALYACLCLWPLLSVGDVVRFGASFVFSALLMATFSFLVERAAQIQRYYSEHDPLTGCLNRRSFNNRLDAARGGVLHGLILLDVDHFKSINDRFGHLQGDRVLVSVAAILRATLADAGELFRYGGEEFAVLVDRQEQSAVHALAERLRAAMASVGPLPEAVSVSAGVAVWDPEQMAGGRAVDLADTALYEAKRSGRNRVVCASPM